MDIYVFRGLPGSPTIETANKLLFRSFDRIIDLTDHWSTDQGNLFITESYPEEAKEAIQMALRTRGINRVAICGSMNKGWIEEVIDQTELEDVSVYWLVVEGAVRPGEKSKRFYDRLEETFELDLTVDA